MVRDFVEIYGNLSENLITQPFNGLIANMKDVSWKSKNASITKMKILLFYLTTNSFAKNWIW